VRRPAWTGLVSHDLREVAHEIVEWPEQSELSEPPSARLPGGPLALEAASSGAQEQLENAQLEGPPLSSRVHERCTRPAAAPPRGRQSVSRRGVGLGKAVKRVVARLRGGVRGRIMLTV
jgi:hypothetical protein